MVSLISILTKYASRQRGPRNCLWKVLPRILPQHRRPWYSPPSKLLISLIYLPCLLLICGVRISWCCFDIYFAGDSDIIKSLPGDHWEMLQFLELVKSLVVTLRIKFSFFLFSQKIYHQIWGIYFISELCFYDIYGNQVLILFTAKCI